MLPIGPFDVISDRGFVRVQIEQDENQSTYTYYLEVLPRYSLVLLGSMLSFLKGDVVWYDLPWRLVLVSCHVMYLAGLTFLVTWPLAMAFCHVYQGVIGWD